MDAKEKEKLLNENLRHEYVLLQGHFESFDTRVLTIKSWGTLVISGVVGIGFKDKSVAVCVVAIFAALCLWYIEAKWKCFQYSFQDRIKLLEAWFRGELKEEIAPFQIHAAWGKSFNAKYRKHAAVMAKLPYVAMPYVFVIVVGVIGVVIFSMPQ